jgi:hypothetical protein
MMPTRARALAASALLCLVVGCVTAGSGQRSGSSTVLNAAQLAAANTDNLYDAIIKLRPEWLTSRGPTSVTDLTPSGVDVYQSGNLMGKAEYLKDVRMLDVTEVRYFDTGQASARFGMGHPRGVIEIIRR